MKPTRRVWLLAMAVIVLAALVAWWLWPDHDPVFHGKRESQWIREIKPGDGTDPAQPWRGFGPEGVRVLARGLDRELSRANSPWKRIYRKTHGWLASGAPAWLTDLLPRPSPGPGPDLRIRLIDLLQEIGPDAVLAAPSVARALRDEDPAVRWVATTFFVGSGFPESVHEGVLDQTDPRLKRRLLPVFMRTVEARRQHPMRASAIRALGYYSEEAGRVAPLLTNLLHDGDPMVRLIAAIALHRVDPVQAREAGAVSVVIEMSSQFPLALMALSLLKEFRTEADLVVPALIEVVEQKDPVFVTHALMSLEHFAQIRPDLVFPSIERAAQRQDEVGRQAAAALERLESGVGWPPIEQP